MASPVAPPRPRPAKPGQRLNGGSARDAPEFGDSLQAASVVIMCEPQVKPSMETQAVARAHRMGQVRKVQVHRLLTVNTVDQRMLDILRSKTALFDVDERRTHGTGPGLRVRPSDGADAGVVRLPGRLRTQQSGQHLREPPGRHRPL
ncbi:hypothetical protein Pth03_74490 [Planotetraspora thailandica]|uniref:Helicase C-terminal domain-containing protein n=1 Tax=Planotetraspora thailandica TaxID=487172 RepID=A0A8J3Y1D6_9ACTN|nr:hypothetical protein Pth03_74490 [Planotetraspora thailandica]